MMTGDDCDLNYNLMIKMMTMKIMFICREPLKIAIYLERKISLARAKLGSRHARTKGWVAKYTTLLKLPLHDLFLVAASPYRWLWWRCFEKLFLGVKTVTPPFELGRKLWSYIILGTPPTKTKSGKFGTIDPNCETHPPPQFHIFVTFSVNLPKISGKTRVKYVIKTVTYKSLRQHHHPHICFFSLP